MICSKYGDFHSCKHRWCRECQNSYMRESRKRGKWLSQRNYPHIRVGLKIISEHRFEMQHLLGRKLHRLEYVHHLPGGGLAVVSPKEHYHRHHNVSRDTSEDYYAIM